MTTLMDRFTGTTDEPEETRVPGVPWWAGVYGYDPAIPVTDWAVAAQCAAMACAVRMFGGDAGRAERWPPRKAAPATRWAQWLLGAADDADAVRRRLALRLTCEQTAETDADRILADAEELHAAVSPGMRLR
jgi:hypothetical protein